MPTPFRFAPEHPGDPDSVFVCREVYLLGKPVPPPEELKADEFIVSGSLGLSHQKLTRDEVVAGHVAYSHGTMEKQGARAAVRPRTRPEVKSKPPRKIGLWDAN